MSDLINFRNLGISETMLESLRRKGFEEPSPIQALTIPLLLAGEKDVIGQAQTGTGKTAAFGIPIIETLERGDGLPQALILSPTRELSIQIAEELNSLKGTKALRIAPFYGGQSIEIQLRHLRDGVDIAIGTPGRVMDLIERGKLRLDALDFAVLDEADEMLNMGFIDDIKSILSGTPADKRMLMFSATMPPEILEIAKNFMREYEIVRTRREEPGAGLTDQIYFEVRRESKLEALSRIIDMEEDIYAMVFCRTRTDVDELVEKLQIQGYGVEALHGDIAQAQRTKVINRFKKKQFQILIATDVAARGIDVNDLTHVINYSIPQGAEAYIHRIGRTGRAGKTGTAITFVTPSENRLLTMIKRSTNNQIRREDLPGGRDIVRSKKAHFAERIESISANGEHEDYMEFAEELLAGSDPATVLASVLKLQFKDELLESTYSDLSKRRERTALDDRGKARLFIGVGKGDGYGAVRLLDLIYERTGIKSFRLGKVECFDKFSFVNAKFVDAERIIEAFHRQNGPHAELAKTDAEGNELNDELPGHNDRKPKREPKREFQDKPPRRKLRELVAGDDAPLKEKKKFFSKKEKKN